MIPEINDIISYINTKMSADNNDADRSSIQFQILVPEEGQGDPFSGEIFLSFDESDQNSSQNGSLESENMGVIVDEDTYMIVNRKEFTKICSEHQWQEFILKHQKAFALKMDQNELTSKTQTPILNYIERNTIVLMQCEDIGKRKSLFSIANTYPQIEQQFILRHRQELQQSKENMLTVLSFDFSEQDLSNFKKNLLKMHKIIKKIGEQHDRNSDALRLHQHQKEIMQWIYDTLIRYAIEDQQVRYCKGLEYICLGIVVSYPEFDLPKYTQLFQHFMHVIGFRQLYLEGSPRFFSELRKIQEVMRESQEQMYLQIENQEGDYKNLFITYFRSCLIYRVNDPNTIRKIFQLLFVEGIPLIRTLLLRILTKTSKYVMGQEQFLQFVSSKLVTHYFCQSDEVQKSAGYRLQRLFIV